MIKFLTLDSTGQIGAIQIDAKPIVMMLQMEKDLCNDRDILVALTSDSTIHFIDLSLKEVVYIFRPQLISASCDIARSMCLNYCKTHIMTCTNGGYVVIWSLESVFRYLKEEEQPGKIKLAKLFNLNPVKMTHSLCIEGLISCVFYGNIILLVNSYG